jgi:hypothetical protein
VTRAELRQFGHSHVVARCDTSSAESVTAASGRSRNRWDRAVFSSTPRRCYGPAGSKTCRLPNGTRCSPST